MGDLNKKLIHISVPFLIIHSIEEFYFGLPNIDAFTSFISHHIGLTNNITYFLGQLILFVFFAIILFLIMLRKNIDYGGFVVGIILLFEVSHIYLAIISGSYYPGLVTSLILFGLGIWYWYKVLQIKFHK